MTRSVEMLVRISMLCLHLAWHVHGMPKSCSCTVCQPEHATHVVRHVTGQLRVDLLPICLSCSTRCSLDAPSKGDLQHYRRWAQLACGLNLCAQLNMHSTSPIQASRLARRSAHTYACNCSHRYHSSSLACWQVHACCMYLSPPSIAACTGHQ